MIKKYYLVEYCDTQVPFMVSSQDISTSQRPLCFMEGEMLVLGEAQPRGEVNPTLWSETNLFIV